jgi:uncharacterized protein
MEQKTTLSALILGLCIFLGLSVLGCFLSHAAIRFKEYDRTVSVKGLSERDVPADIVIWPIQYAVADNDLGKLYVNLDTYSKTIKEYLLQAGINDTEITISPPAITDKSAQAYSDSSHADFRYTALQTVTVYSNNVALIRSQMGDISELGKKGIALTGNSQGQTDEYIYSKLNDIKPEMIQEATTKAREVAQKFAADSNSKLGKIKQASQGQFTIDPRDTNNPHIKKVRVVSTIEYYLSD